MIKIELTPNQQEQVQQTVAERAPAMKLTLEPLEVRIAPMFDIYSARGFRGIVGNYDASTGVLT
jgi:hypothetical protein